MKRLFVLCFMLLSGVQAFAQLEHYPALINRLGGQQVDEAMVAQLDNSIERKSPSDKQASAAPALTLEIKGTNRAQMVAGDVVILDADIYNNTPNDIQLNFKRTHLSIPMNWTSSICFGITCYAAKTDSLDADGTFTLAAGSEPANFHLNLYCPAGSHADSVIDYIKFFVQGGAEGDTVSSIFIGTLTGLTSVEQSKEAILGLPKIVSVYPSPLVEGSSIRVKVNSPREMSFSYSIFDEVGRQVAFGTTHQRLIQGDNTCQIGELNGLANGNYQVKFTFGDGTIDTRSFQVAH